jgi:hypothetical protein
VFEIAICAVVTSLIPVRLVGQIPPIKTSKDSINAGSLSPQVVETQFALAGSSLPNPTLLKNLTAYTAVKPEASKHASVGHGKIFQLPSNINNSATMGKM